jgi:hypothetical protein
MEKLVVRSMAALVLALGAVALTLIPGLQGEVRRLEMRTGNSPQVTPRFFRGESLAEVARSLLTAAQAVDEGARLENLGRYGGGAVREVRFRLRVSGGYHRLGALLANLESGGDVSRLSSLSLRRRGDGRGDLDVVISILVKAEEDA